MDLATALGAVLVACGAYYTAALLAVATFRQVAPDIDAPGAWQGVSLLKPAVGTGPSFSRLLRTHAAQDHPDFEILVGAGPRDHAARLAVSEIQAEFPRIRVEFVECPEASPGCNGKVEVLERLAERATKPVWIINDADIGVPANYFRILCAELEASDVGLVTCLYGAEGAGSIASQLEAIRTSAEFPPQVLLARWLQGMRFALGSTLALRRETLDRLGGLGSLRGFVGDDYLLGERVARGGLDVAVSSLSVSTHVPDPGGWRDSWNRQLRWSRTIRKQRPGGHLGLVVTWAFPWAAVALAAQPASLWPLAALAVSGRLASGAISVARFGGGRALRAFWLLPAADFAAGVVWVWSYFGSGVRWADRRLRLGPGGRIVR